MIAARFSTGLWLSTKRGVYAKPKKIILLYYCSKHDLISYALSHVLPVVKFTSIYMFM